MHLYNMLIHIFIYVYIMGCVSLFVCCVTNMAQKLLPATPKNIGTICKIKTEQSQKNPIRNAVYIYTYISIYKMVKVDHKCILVFCISADSHRVIESYSHTVIFITTYQRLPSKSPTSGKHPRCLQASGDCLVPAQLPCLGSSCQRHHRPTSHTER